MLRMGGNHRSSSRAWTPSVWYYYLRRLIARWDVTPGQITGVYLVLGFLALYVSDVLLVQLIDDPAVLSQFQAIKGGAEVVVTAGFIFVLARRSRRSLRTTNARLERQQEELQVLHRVLRHNLRNDVTVIVGYATSLLEEVEDGRHQAWCEKLVTAADRLIHYADQTQKINKATADDAVRTFDLTEVVSGVIETNPELSRTATITTTLPETAPVRAHRTLGTAVRELLDNAVRHSDREAPAVSVRVDPAAGSPHRTELVVSDDGPGIPAHVRRTIEERGESPLVHLDGLGLWLVSWVATISDGELAIDDRDPRGSTVRIQLRKARSELGLPTHRWLTRGGS
jgi:signal transduction histidine kinase